MGKHDRHELPNKKRLKKAFYKLADGDTLTREQFKRLCYKFYLSPTNKTVNDLFDELDKNRDDVLTFDECEELIKKQWTPLDKRMEEFLTDLQKCRAGKEGPITLDELRLILTQDGDEALEEGEVEEIFNTLDINKDNQIEEKELANAIFHIEKILSRAPSRSSDHGKRRRRRKSSGGSSNSGSSDSGSHHGEKHDDEQETGEATQNEPEPEIVPQTNVEMEQVDETKETTTDEKQEETEAKEETTNLDAPAESEEKPNENTEKVEENMEGKTEEANQEKTEAEASQEKSEEAETKPEETENKPEENENKDTQEKTEETEKKDEETEKGET